MYDRNSGDETQPLLSSVPKEDYNSNGDFELTDMRLRKKSNCEVDCSREKEMKPTDRKAKHAIIVCIFIAFLFMTAEFVGGYLANSIAIFSDALHMLSDIAGLLLSLVGIVMGSHQATNRFTFGFKRLEIVASLLSILLIWAMAGVLMYTSILRMIDPPLVDGEIMLFVACLGMLSNFIMFAVLHFGGAGHAHGGHGHSHGGGHGHAHGGDKGKDHGHSHGSEEGHGHAHGGEQQKDDLRDVQQVEADTTKSSEKGQGHSHGGKKCTGHSKKTETNKSNSKGHGDSDGGQALGKDSINLDTNKPKKKGHGHSHGGKKCTGHGKVKQGDDETHVNSTENVDSQKKSKSKKRLVKIEDELEQGHGHAHGQDSDDSQNLETVEIIGHKRSSGSETKHTHTGSVDVEDEAIGKGSHAGNINVRSAMIHVMGDLLQNIGVIIAAGFIWYNPVKYKIVDPICTLVFAIGTVLLSLRVIKDAGEVLMDMSPRDIDIEMIKKNLCGIPGVTGVHDLHCWFMAYGEKSLSCHIQVNEDASGSVCTQGVLSKAQAVLRKLEIGHTTIQVEDPDHKPADHSLDQRTPGICVATPLKAKPIAVQG